MAGDLVAARALVEVDETTAELLAASARPIVLLPRRRAAPVAEAVAPELAELGVFLPYSPLHHLLLADLARPLVVTSGNRIDEPIAIDDGRAAVTLGPLVDGVLGHDRPIWSRYDDSVARVTAGRTMTIRRARGYSPVPLRLPAPAAQAVLGVGAQLKNTVTLAVGDRAITGPHIGDLSDADTHAAFTESIAALSRLHAIEPAVVAHDLHPAYLSTQHARRWPANRRIGVQHHHAHVAATAAEHGVSGPFLGVAYDGLGLGEDGTLWGGELLLCDYTGYRRLGRFGTAPLPGGEAAVRKPARMALGYLLGAGQHVPDDLVERVGHRQVEMIRRMIATGVNCPRASSAGRLFDAVASLLGLCDEAGYEGEAAVLPGAQSRDRAGAARPRLRRAADGRAAPRRDHAGAGRDRPAGGRRRRPHRHDDGRVQHGQLRRDAPVLPRRGHRFARGPRHRQRPRHAGCPPDRPERGSVAAQTKLKQLGPVRGQAFGAVGVLVVGGVGGRADTADHGREGGRRRDARRTTGLGVVGSDWPEL